MGKIKLLIVIGAIGVILITTFGLKKTTTESQVPKVGYDMGLTAPDFTLKTLEGKTVKLSDYRGKPVYLNFWTSWCPACKDELPEIEKFYEKNKGRIEILTINITYNDRLADIRAILAKNSDQFPVLLDEEENHSVTDLYGVYGIPASFFIDKNGFIQDHHVGGMTLTTLEEGMKKAQ
ncbi:TlpA family protein disulfide reductase [Desulfitobacterium sp. Sab5]|uniref:TlpA family protein disulfide reductase n=1 Tax=Desulfitobacterium nosdiversum TaxID=3375356 RepID=UPI003CF4ADAF